MTMRALLEWALIRYRDRPATTDRRGTRTYADLDRRSSQIAAALHELGVRPGDRVGVLLDNQSEYLEAELGIARLGAVRVPMLVKSSALEIAFYLATAECSVVLAGGEALLTLRQACDGSAAAPIVVRVPGINGAEPPMLDGELDYETCLAAMDPMHAQHLLASIDPADDDAYALRFTGGTSGRPKGIVMSQRTMANVVNNLLLSLPVGDDEVVAHVHPVSHASGKIMYTWFMRGAHQVFLPTFSLDPAAVLATIEQYRVTAMFLVPSAINALLDSGLVDGHDMSSLRWVIYGGSPIPARRVLEAIDAFGPIMVQIYGSSEAPNALTLLSSADHVFDGTPPDRLRSAGRVAYNVEVQVLDENDRPLPAGAVGEIASRGAHTMSGYWRDPALTTERVRNGWVHTGDMGRFDADGYLYVVDRKDDVIISGGFNVWPAEVEDALCAVPEVRDAAVVGLPDDRWGEAVTAVVVSDAPVVTEQWLRGRMREVLPGYKVPKRVEVRRGELPKSAAGKVLRRAVRDELQGRGSVDV